MTRDDKHMKHCHCVVCSPWQNTLLKSNPWLARKSILELYNDKSIFTSFSNHFKIIVITKKKKSQLSQFTQVVFLNESWEATLTYLTDELYVRGRPVEWFREYIKIKSLCDVPAERDNRKRQMSELVYVAQGLLTTTCMLVIQKLDHFHINSIHLLNSSA